MAPRDSYWNHHEGHRNLWWNYSGCWLDQEYREVLGREPAIFEDDADKLEEIIALQCGRYERKKSWKEGH